MIAANLLAPLQPLIHADTGGAKITPGTAAFSVLDQLGNTWLR